MDVQGLQMSATKPVPGLFKRNPPIAGEAEAIESAQAGDAEAFSKLYALHKRRVYTLCLRMLGNVSEAEAMTQQAFLHLFRKIATMLECSTGNSKSQLHKARLKLRELLRQPELSNQPAGLKETAK